MKPVIRFLFSIVLFLLFSCSESELASPDQLDRLRVLAIQVNTPEVNDSGTNVTVTPYLSDTKGEGRQIQVEVIGCSEPKISSGALPNCDEQEDRTEITQYTYDPSTASGTDVLASPDYTGSVTSFSFTMPSNFLESKTSLEQVNGAYYMLEINLSTSSESLSTIKRVLVSPRTVLNSNPTINGLSFANEEFTATSYPEEGAFAVTMSDDSAQTYSTTTSDGETLNLTESIAISYYSSRGEFFEYGHLGK